MSRVRLRSKLEAAEAVGGEPFAMAAAHRGEVLGGRLVLVARVVVAPVVGLELQRERREVVETGHVGTSSLGGGTAGFRAVSGSAPRPSPYSVAPPTATSPDSIEPPSASTPPNATNAP